MRLALGSTLDVAAVRRRACRAPAAVRLRSAPRAYRDGLDLCPAIDRFDFALQAASEGGLLVGRRVARHP